MRSLRPLFTAILFALTTTCLVGIRDAAAQSYFAGIAVHAGSLGIGAEFGLRINELLGVRAGVDFLPSGVSFPI